jgi:hypothetical protein
MELRTHSARASAGQVCRSNRHAGRPHRYGGTPLLLNSLLFDDIALQACTKD